MSATSERSQRELAGTAGHRPAAAFAVLGATQFTLILAIGMLTLALPQVARDLGLSRAGLALLSAGYSISFGGLLLLGGRLADRAGRRRMFLTGTAIFAAASALAGLAPGFAVLLAARLAQGAAAALTAPAGMALIQDVFADPSRRGRAVAAWGGISSAGATAGTILGGAAATLSWRSAFAVTALIAAAAAASGRRLLPAGPPPRAVPVDVPGAVLAVTGLGALSFGLISTLDAGWTAPRVAAPLLGGAALLAGFAVAQGRSPVPLLPLRFVASPRRAAALVAVFLAAGGAASIGFFLSLYLQQIRGWTAAAASLAFVPYLLTLPASLIAGRLLGRAGTRLLTVTGLLAGAAGLALLGRLGGPGGYAAVILPGLAVFSAGAGLTFAGAFVAAVDQPGREAGALAAGVANTAMEIGPTIGLALLVAAAGARTSVLIQAGHPAAVAASGGYGFALSVAAAAFAAAALLAARALPARTASPSEPSQSEPSPSEPSPSEPSPSEPSPSEQEES